MNFFKSFYDGYEESFSSIGKNKEFPGALAVKDLPLLLLWPGFNPWPGFKPMLRVQLKICF